MSLSTKLIKNCSICLNDLKVNSNKKYIKCNMCDEEFHDKCLTKWLTIKNTCPVCRQEIIIYNEQNKCIKCCIYISRFCGYLCSIFLIISLLVLLFYGILS